MLKADKHLRENFADNLRMEMLKNKMRHTDLAGMLNLSSSQISHWLSFRNLPSWESYSALCTIFKLEEWELITAPKRRDELKRAERNCREFRLDRRAKSS